MLALNVLVAATDRNVVQAMSTYKVAYLRQTNDTGWTRYDAVVYGGSKIAHPRIKIKEQNVESPAEVTCTCTFFQMNLETVLALHGNTAPARSNGVMPMKRNPKLKPGLCPHLYVLALTLGKQWKETESAEETPAAGVNPRLRTLR